jgi:hypothetical protein
VIQVVMSGSDPCGTCNVDKDGGPKRGPKARARTCKME